LFPKNALSGARLALAALLFAALPAQAADKTVLRPILEVEQGWDSNIFNTSSSPNGSPITNVRPGLWIENSGELGHARLGLTAVGRSVWQESNLSGVDGNARGDFERTLTPRLSFFGDGLFDHYSGYQEIDGSPNQIILPEQPKWNRDEIGGGIRYLLTPRLTMRLGGSAGRMNYERVKPNSLGQLVDEGNYRDRSLYGARSALLYQVTSQDQLKASLDFDNTQYQDLGTGTNDSGIWNSEVGWTRNWSPVWTTSASIGVRRIDSTQNGVPQVGTAVSSAPLELPQFVELPSQSFSSSGTGLVGSLSIRRIFPRSSIELSYDRDTRSTGGAGRTNFDIDSFSLTYLHRLAERVQISLTGNYSLFESVTDKLPSVRTGVEFNPADFTFRPVCGSGATPAQVDMYLGLPVYQCFGGSSSESRKYTTLQARLDWKLQRKLDTYAVLRYYRSITDYSIGGGSSFQTQDFDKTTFLVGFRYAWDLGL